MLLRCLFAVSFGDWYYSMCPQYRMSTTVDGSLMWTLSARPKGVHIRGTLLYILCRPSPAPAWPLICGQSICEQPCCTRMVICVLMAGRNLQSGPRVPLLRAPSDTMFSQNTAEFASCRNPFDPTLNFQIMGHRDGKLKRPPPPPE